MSTASATAKSVNLHDYQEQSKEKSKSQNSVVETDSNSSVLNDSTNSIDHTGYSTGRSYLPLTIEAVIITVKSMITSDTIEI